MAEVVQMQLAFVPPFAAAIDDLVHLLHVLPKAEVGLISESLDNVPVTLSVCGGQTVLSEAQFNDLSKGDVVLPEVWYPQTKRAELMLLSGNRTLYQAHCQYEDETLTFLDSWNPISENEMKNSDQLEITLTFELDRKTVTVGDLKSIQAGYTFAMTNNSATPVTILANGKPVARGRLVDINGVIGVQVTDAQ
jgi:type III secretion protein Q